MDPMAMKVEEQYGLHHDDDFEPDQMVEEDDQSSDHSPQNDYGTYNFQSSSNAQFDHIFSSAPFQTPFSAPRPLHPLNTNILWPSQLTNPSENSPPVSMPLQQRPIAPIVQSPPSAPPEPVPTPPKSAPTLPTSRKTLTDDARRRMCKYHEENPTVKQTEIGGKF